MPAAYRDTPLAPLFPFLFPNVRLPKPEETISEGFAVQPTDLGLASPAMQLGDTPEETHASGATCRQCTGSRKWPR